MMNDGAFNPINGDKTQTRGLRAADRSRLMLSGLGLFVLVQLWKSSDVPLNMLWSLMRSSRRE